MTERPTTFDRGRVSAELVDLTVSLGRPERDLVILAEGNTSERIGDDEIVVKASGSSMAGASADDFVVCQIGALAELFSAQNATQADLTALLDAGEGTDRRRRGSIEALVHVAVHALSPDPAASRFVGHTHPTAVVGVLASVHAEQAYTRHAYSDEAVVIGRPLFVPYAQPGIDLGLEVHRRLRDHLDRTGDFPQLILLANHGIVAIAPTASGVEGISEMAVKGARVRTAAYSAGGLAPLSEAAVDKFFARPDIAERRSNIAGGKLGGRA